MSLLIGSASAQHAATNFSSSSQLYNRKHDLPQCMLETPCDTILRLHNKGEIEIERLTQGGGEGGFLGFLEKPPETLWAERQGSVEQQSMFRYHTLLMFNMSVDVLKTRDGKVTAIEDSRGRYECLFVLRT